VKHYESSATIAAPPEAVWPILTDASEYPSWNPAVVEIEGRIAPGEKIKVKSTADPKRAFPVKVSEFQEPGRMVWRGGMPLGLFKGVRTFELAARNGGTEFRMREEYTGPMLPLIWRSMPDLQPSFDEFAAALKARAESPT
jgi:hypothetical protein